MKLFIDTSIFVDLLRSRQVEPSKSLFRSLQDGSTGFASVITVAELAVGAYRSPRSDALEKTLRLLSIVNVVDLNREIAVNGGRIYADLMKRGEEVELNDCLIAATSLSLGIEEIVTRDLDHFRRIEGIRAVTPEELGF
ncbi:MAG: type II toxin-antitoxin system VapC family toxin [Methanothrix sp.]|nr:type II toxin-antitoxin system VapC family toxin [Methanothrix sp.]MCX8207544.1 type II toxin-antitoxin system VapC family toxin [Methanothrix sp.]